MRKKTLASLLTALACCCSAHAKNINEPPLPFFMDPEFHFSEIDTVCLAPILDLRPDKTVEMTLDDPGINHIKSPNQSMADTFKYIGYPTATCNPVSATVADMTSPTDAFLQTLDFGPSQWLLVLAVEDMNVVRGLDEVRVVVCASLFRKRPGGPKLVWHDRWVGRSDSEVMMFKRNESIRINGALSLNDGIDHLVCEFEMRTKKRPMMGFVVDQEHFDSSCDVVWSALNDAFSKDPRRYHVAFTQSSQFMAIFISFRASAMGNEDRVVLRPGGTACSMEFTQSYLWQETNDWIDLSKQIRASLPRP